MVYFQIDSESVTKKGQGNAENYLYGTSWKLFNCSIARIMHGITLLFDKRHAENCKGNSMGENGSVLSLVFDPQFLVLLKKGLYAWDTFCRKFDRLLKH